LFKSIEFQDASLQGVELREYLEAVVEDECAINPVVNPKPVCKSCTPPNHDTIYNCEI
jgi:hypothetical protein